MAPKKVLSLNEQLALLDDPAPADFDPEALDREFSDPEVSDGDNDSGAEDDGSEGDVDRAREHYLPVGTSALRSAAKKGLPATAALGKKYEGSRVSREALYESSPEEEDEDEEEGVSIKDLQEGDIRIGVGSGSEDDSEIDSDDAMGSGDEEGKFSGWKFKGSKTTEGGVVPKRGDKVAGSSDDDEEEEEEEGEEGSGEEGEEGSGEEVESGSEEEGSSSDNERQSGEDGEEDGSESDSGSDSDADHQRKVLSRMMADEKKSISANIAKASQTDAEKGAAVRHQQKTFDSFLSARIKLQKALIAINTLPSTLSSLPSDSQSSWKAAEASALKLWNTLYTLRTDIASARTPNLKRKATDAEINDATLLSDVWAKMARLETESTPWRDAVLEKWSAKTQTVTTVSVGKKLNNAAPRSLTASIRETLTTDRERLIARTRVPRSCAPVQAAKDADADPEVFDDTDLYQQLLKTLVDQRMVDSAGAGAGGVVQWTSAMRDARKKKAVDTKASKGRKMRYHVHEKLQNFMAPLENNRWQESQIEELFSSLLGQRIRVDEEEEDEDMEDLVMDDGLRLFR